MGSVIATFKIMPEGVETDLDSIEKSLKEKMNPQRMERVPIAFGINSIKMIKIIDEKEGEIDRITDEIKNINGVREVEIIGLTRSL